MNVELKLSRDAARDVGGGRSRSEGKQRKVGPPGPVAVDDVACEMLERVATKARGDFDFLMIPV